MFKVQIGFDYDFTKELFASFEILDYVQHGHFASFILKGEKDILVEKLKELNPVMIETIPLSLEEIFIHKTSELGYMLDEVKNEK
jgi:ABC-2 type transport system ATP-binding protein